MGRRKKGSVPQLCNHKASGRSYATDPATGTEVYFGPTGDRATMAAYLDWLDTLGTAPDPAALASSGPVSVAQLVKAFEAWAKTYYVKRGKQTSMVNCIKDAMRPVIELYAELPAAEFAPACLKAVRAKYLERGNVRTTANKHTDRVRMCFRWGVENGLVPAVVLVGLQAVRSLPAGRGAKEKGPVKPVPEADLEKTLEHLSEAKRLLVRLQILLACRPGELLTMRPCDIDRTALPWVYTPEGHKTEHHGRARRIFIGPQARALLQPLLDRGGAADRWLFPSRGQGFNLDYDAHLTPAGYRVSIDGACKRAGVAHWHPSQLRHNGLTLVRAAAGVEAAQAVADHSEISTTQIYAERLDGLAREVVERIG